jgi:hypothetical protein
MMHNTQERILNTAVEGTALWFTWELWNNHETHQCLSVNNYDIFDHKVTTVYKATLKLDTEDGKETLVSMCITI